MWCDFEENSALRARKQRLNAWRSSGTLLASAPPSAARRAYSLKKNCTREVRACAFFLASTTTGGHYDYVPPRVCSLAFVPRLCPVPATHFSLNFFPHSGSCPRSVYPRLLIAPPHGVLCQLQLHAAAAACHSCCSAHRVLPRMRLRGCAATPSLGTSCSGTATAFSTASLSSSVSPAPSTSASSSGSKDSCSAATTAELTAPRK